MAVLYTGQAEENTNIVTPQCIFMRGPKYTTIKAFKTILFFFPAVSHRTLYNELKRERFPYRLEILPVICVYLHHSIELKHIKFQTRSRGLCIIVEVRTINDQWQKQNSSTYEAKPLPFKSKFRTPRIE